MIYLVSKKIPESSRFKKITIEESKALINSFPVVQFDTETTGLDCHIDTLQAIQFGYKDFTTNVTTAIVVDTNTVDILEYKNIIESKFLIGHNLKFDLKFLYNYGIVPLHLHDTMVCEQLFYLGYKPRSVSYKLSDVLLRNTGIEIDKSFQKQIAHRGLTEEGVIYAASDVMYLQDLRLQQIKIAKSRNCEAAVILENNFVPAIAYLEWCGIHLDEQEWTKKMTFDKNEVEKYESQLNDYVKSHEQLQEFVSNYIEPSLFDTEISTEPKVNISWSSSKQVIPVFDKLGFNTIVIDKETKKEKKSIEEKVISVQKGIADDFLDIYLKYKGAEKNATSYGQNYLNLVNPKTGRLHTVFTQIGTVTGRMSSGSKKKNESLAIYKQLPKDDVGFVNLQNLPARGDYGSWCRSCFTSTGNNVFISCDYSAEESRVQADVWEEKSLLDAFANGIDTHNLYAKLCFPEELKNIDVKDVKKVRSDLRQAAKSAEFAVSYGSNGSSIAKSIGMSEEKAKIMVQGLIKNMPGMSKFKNKTIKFLKQNGYIIINEQTGHRVYWPEWLQWKAGAERMDATFMRNYTLYHKGTNDEVCKMVKRHFQLSHDWFEKNVLNYPIQGGSAIVLKEAATNVFKWIVQHGYFGIILFCVFVHDEIDAECPKNISKQFANVMKIIMQNAANKYYKKLPIPAEESIGNHWIH